MSRASRHLAIGIGAITLGFAGSGCTQVIVQEPAPQQVSRGHGPPPHAPAHGYRAKTRKASRWYSTGDWASTSWWVCPAPTSGATSTTARRAGGAGSAATVSTAPGSGSWRPRCRPACADGMAPPGPGCPGSRVAMGRPRAAATERGEPPDAGGNRTAWSSSASPSNRKRPVDVLARQQGGEPEAVVGPHLVPGNPIERGPERHRLGRLLRLAEAVRRRRRRSRGSSARPRTGSAARPSALLRSVSPAALPRPRAPRTPAASLRDRCARRAR